MVVDLERSPVERPAVVRPAVDAERARFEDASGSIPSPDADDGAVGAAADMAHVPGQVMC